MKQLEQHLKELIDDVAIQQQIKQHKYIGQHHMQRGHTMFQMNLKTAEITLAKIDYVAIVDQGVKKSLVVETDFWYESALNKKNVTKKFLKRLQELKKKKT